MFNTLDMQMWARHLTIALLFNRGGRPITLLRYFFWAQRLIRCVCVQIHFRFLVRAKRAPSLRASEASHLYFYNNLNIKSHELPEIAQKMIGNGVAMIKIVMKSITKNL